MRLLLFISSLIFLAVGAYGQGGTISGKVTSADLQIPLAKASVFLSNATFGTATANDGTFTLSNVKPGQYELVVSYVGYDSYHQTIMVGDAPIKLNIEMHFKSIGLNEVSISVHKFSKENFAMFVKYFIGESENAKKCKILNPKVVDLHFNKMDKVLSGHSDEFILIENRALGYRLKYLLSDFKYDGIKEIISYSGQPLYEDLKGSKGQIAKWRKLREDAYYGSSMHFYRSIISNSLDTNGFKIYRLIRKPNPERPPQIVIMKKLEQFGENGNYLADSLRYWDGMYRMHKYNETLIKQPYHAADIAGTTDQPGVFGIAFPDYLYVVYTKKHDNIVDNELYRPLDMENFMVTIVTLYTKAAFFDLNGIVISGKSTLYEGAWARNKIAEMLPVDYAPQDKAQAK